MNEQDTRFASLIKPIRDLAENWDVDIAHTLEDYLDDLEEIRLSVEGQGNLNFAEAALLIQGSTAVYSKKVEHLYSLVFQALELISNNRGDNKGKTSQGGGANQEEESYCWSDDPSYLLLDDVVPTANNIDIIDKLEVEQNRRRSNGGRYSISSDVSRNSRSSALLMNSLLQDSQGATSLKMSSCHMNSEGALVFANLTSSSSVSSSRRSVGQSTPVLQNDSVSNTVETDYGPMDDNDGWSDNGGLVEDYDDPMDQAEGGILEPQAEEAAPPVNGKSSNHMAKAVSFNPLALLDPYDPVMAEQSKPVKRDKRTYRVRKGTLLSRKQSTLLAAKGTKTISQPDVTHKELLDWLYPEKSKQFIAIGNAFSSVYKSRKKSGYYYTPTDEFVQNDPVMQNGLDENEGWGEDSNEPIGNDFDEGNGYGGGYFNDGVSDYGDFDDGDVGADIPPDDLTVRVENALSDAGLSMTDTSASGMLSQGTLAYRNQFENLCRQHIKNFMRGAETYARETNLSRRVSEWTARLEPLLHEQDMRPEFDIHAYSDRALQRVAQKSSKGTPNAGNTENESVNTVHFSDVVQGESSYEVGRMFLACLQLANLGNLDFSQKKDSISDFDVNMLNSKSNRLQISEYRAPSVGHQHM